MRTALRLSLAVLVTIAAGTVPVLLNAAPAEASTTPGQVVTVRAASASSTRATIDLWSRQANGTYVHAWGPALGYVGELGVGTAREGVARTPAGVFGLTQAFGNGKNPGTKLPWFTAGPSDWWDGESGTPAYNTHVHQARSPGSASENLYTAGYVYSRAVVIDYNRFPAVAGRGSAFFLHVTNGQPTAGCVALLASQLDTIMRWLIPTQHPVISIGVGSAATSIITHNNNVMATRNPMGVLDGVTAVGGAKARIRGWAADPDAMSAALHIHVYVDGRGIGAYQTGAPRPDVARIKHAGPRQGFDFVAAIGRGRHTVCAYAINIFWGTTNPRLGCATVTIS
ncbi:MAG TPA: L,D-transpeptidase family protein [Jatrophihabitans sp.]|jgi:L,D-peptidoglycan transpeptidase YkuD (ErfK/YbiS/YcfS/YnhG family)